MGQTRLGWINEVQEEYLYHLIKEDLENTKKKEDSYDKDVQIEFIERLLYALGNNK